MPPAQQWIGTTLGRLAVDPQSWMQAVHWVGGSGLYVPSRKHGPGWGVATVQIAQECAALKECRPSVDYLARKLGMSERTVQYHLGILREAGLLVYREVGTRRSKANGGNLASRFERVIPPDFDEALGIRTVLRREDEPAVARVAVGIAEAGRKTIARLARKACRKVRGRRSRTASPAKIDCTLMSVADVDSSRTASTHLRPSESKLASGPKKSPTPKQQRRRPQKLNRVGRRWQLARQLLQQVPWLTGTSLPRIAWIVGPLADAGWSVDEVRALIALGSDPYEVRRPSGLLAARLRSHEMWAAPGRRAALVEGWRDSRAATSERHAEWTAPQVRAAKAPRVRAALADVFDQFNGRRQPGAVEVAAGAAADLSALDEAALAEQKTAALADPGLVLAALDGGAPEDLVRHLYSDQAVDQALHLNRLNRSTNIWGINV
ncbi:helix-turn-helix domain-containing protein [Streptomyces sp. NPDC058657]|uniref:helix-turn-helix domain-containing protein n=1 Tax=unclassified Streptomyces TaxID=2593676 RepID=UPI00364DEDF4